MHTSSVASELAGAPTFSLPQYTRAEAVADRVLHLVALPAAVAAVTWLLLAIGPTGGVAQAGCGLVGMLTRRGLQSQ
jgi:hypothetical protein